MNNQPVDYYEEDEEAVLEGITFYCTVRASGTYAFHPGDYMNPPDENIFHEELVVESAYYYIDDEEITATPEQLRELVDCFDAVQILLDEVKELGL